jgi:6-phosphogluconolactonase
MGGSGDLKMKKPEKREVSVFDKRGELYDFLIQKWKEISEKAIEKKRIFTVALSGGETPVEFYQRLELSKNLLAWDKTHIFLVDERFVPFEHPDSNYGMIRKDLLTRISLPSSNVHPIRIFQTPQISAEKYEEDLRSFFDLGNNDFPEFDLILLGIGKEGHTASLFPGNPALFETSRLAAAVNLDVSKYDRISMTLPLINRADNVVFLILGQSKSLIIRRILEESECGLPASLVRPIGGRLFFFLDREASQLLSNKNVSSENKFSL